VLAAPVTDMWHDTTTLYTRVVGGHATAAEEGAAPLIASGVLHLAVCDFLKELTTFRAGGAGIVDEAGAVASFGMLWLNELWDVYSPLPLAAGAPSW
jgi:cholesterol oxidase